MENGEWASDCLDDERRVSDSTQDASARAAAGGGQRRHRRDKKRCTYTLNHDVVSYPQPCPRLTQRGRNDRLRRRLLGKGLPTYVLTFSTCAGTYWADGTMELYGCITIEQADGEEPGTTHLHATNPPANNCNRCTVCSRNVGDRAFDFAVRARWGWAALTARACDARECGAGVVLWGAFVPMSAGSR
eukprot:235531-Rhodomonas_salina.2